MPPKIKVTKDAIINAGVDIVKKHGEQGLNARTIADFLNCSTQPIFSNFSSMDDLRLAVAEKANELYEKFAAQEIERGEFPTYKASGMAYIRFAKEEKELFKLLYMRDRTDEISPSDPSFDNQILAIVQETTGLNEMNAQLFHLEMWAYVHGIATMFATGFLDLDWELVSKMLTDSYQGLRKQYGMEQ